MPFLNDLVARQVHDFQWQLVEPLVYQGNRDRFVVPVGEESDFASVPRPVQWLFPKSGRYTKAAVLHDHLWKNGAALGIGMKDADGLFRKCMHELKVPFLQRWTMWSAVRIVSLARSHFKEGPEDLPRVVAVVLYPGAFVAGGALVVLALQLGFAALETVAALVLSVFRALPGARNRVKPVVRPKLRWGA